MKDIVLTIATFFGPIVAGYLGVTFGIKKYLKEKEYERRAEIINFLINVIENIQELEIKSREKNQAKMELSEDQVDTIHTLYKRFRELCVLYGIDNSEEFESLKDNLKEVFGEEDSNVIIFGRKPVSISSLTSLKHSLEDILRKLRYDKRGGRGICGIYAINWHKRKLFHDLPPNCPFRRAVAGDSKCSKGG